MFCAWWDPISFLNRLCWRSPGGSRACVLGVSGRPSEAVFCGVVSTRCLMTSGRPSTVLCTSPSIFELSRKTPGGFRTIFWPAAGPRFAGTGQESTGPSTLPACCKSMLTIKAGRLAPLLAAQASLRYQFCSQHCIHHPRQVFQKRPAVPRSSWFLRVRILLSLL